MLEKKKTNASTNLLQKSKSFKLNGSRFCVAKFIITFVNC
jgi:hypothetical protein